MRTTIEIPDDLFRKAKAQAALEGVRLRDVIERGLRLALAQPAPSTPRCNATRTPAVPALCDVNVLLALTTDRHAFHTTAVRWLDGVSAGGAVICRVAQTGLLRLLNNPAVMREDVLDAQTVDGRLSFRLCPDEWIHTGHFRSGFSPVRWLDLPGA
jgi:hypothetical protein